MLVAERRLRASISVAICDLIRRLIHVPATLVDREVRERL
jgi:hypothetical protein